MGSLLAHNIIYRGRTYRNSVATLLPDGTVRIEPFAAETPSTIFVSGEVMLETFCQPNSGEYRMIAKRSDGSVVAEIPPENGASD